ncbi:hypothetical protein [Agromyces aerolatus]|uniref:hypothetical protein n=1 Tax=Agromyces sp. LY-1074 TaxID=3074080 RepID=UPI0028557247|nr:MULTISPECIES: hypothetical protein [unclassified Agromyces]MDR5701455.1 hypothetical protein [Agromyces sp. LY-1074]MDR5704478.1 hypothetical protein [Agromyces sp. LY-1358]
MSELLDTWSEFNVAMVGATAALAGLLIVAMSVNIGTIMKSKTMPARLAASIAALVLAITVCALGLIPGQPLVVYGIEIIVAALAAGVFQWHVVPLVFRQPGVPTSYRFGQSAAGVFPIAAFLLGGVLVVSGQGEAGLIAAAIGSILSIIAALLMAWVVLVELLR